MTVMAAEAGAGAGAAGAESGAAAAASGASKKSAAAKTPPAKEAPAKGSEPAGDKPAKKSGGGKEGAAAAAPSGGRARRSVKWAWSDNRKILIAEFLVCVVVLGLGTIVSPDDSKHDVPRAMIKGSALAGVFFVLTLVATAGGQARRTANAIGTLITASYVLTSADVHNIVSWAAGFFSAPQAGAVAGEGMSAPAATTPPAGPEGTVQA